MDARPAPSTVRRVLTAAGLTGSVEHLGTGQFTEAFLIDRAVVARFPRHRLGATQLLREVEVLGAIGPEMPVAVPAHDVVRLDAPQGEAFAAHRLIPGERLSRRSLVRLDATVRSGIADQLAHFLVAAHACVEQVAHLDLPVLTLTDLASVLTRKTARLLHPRMTAAARLRAEAALSALSRFPADNLVLCHGDLGGNVLFDEVEGRIGVIDFGMASLTDPSVDGASIAAGLGDDLLDEVAGRYPAFSGRQERIRAIGATFALQDALWGAEQGDWHHVDDVLRAYAASA